MAANDQAPKQPVLTSWKEIAAFFNREVRTVQRWEKEEGLPVHRHLHRRQSSVYAYPEELQSWWREQGARLAEQPADALPAKRNSWEVWAAVPAGMVLVGLLLWVNLRSGRESATRLGGPTFPAIALEGTRPQGSLIAPLAADLNGDGQTDVVLSSAGAREIYLIFGGRLPLAGGEVTAAADAVITGFDNGTLAAGQIGDFNGDRIRDLVIHHWLEEPESFRAVGSAYILWGRREWPKKLILPKTADIVFRLDVDQMESCNQPGGPADLNEDGVEDLILSAFQYTSLGRRAAGAVFVLFGRKSWPRELEVASAADVTFRGSRTGETLGRHCAVGNFNGTGSPDVAVYASESALWNLLGSRGKVYVFFGRKPWPAVLEARTDSDLRLEGTPPNSAGVVSSLADLNGDGLDDLVVSRPGLWDANNLPGEVQIWFGGKTRKGILPADSADVVIAGSSPGARFGQSVMASDLDGDGSADLIVSEPGRGNLYLFYGRREWKKRGRLEDHGPVKLFQGDASAGYDNLALGDVDGDSLPEIVFTAPKAGRHKAGRAWILRPYVLVRVDVRPEHEPNVVFFPGLVVARIYGLSRADADLIDPPSVRMASVAPERHVIQDYNGDGFADLQVYFETAKMRLTPNMKQIALTARTRGGPLVGGTDVVEVVSTGAPSSAQGKTSAN